jgi:hypothetical protein
VSDLVSDYVRLATEWGIAMSNSNSGLANSLHDRIQSVHQQIVNAGDEEALFQHVDDSRDSVSFFVASHVKDRNAARAMAVYERLASSKAPFIAASSRYILRELKNDTAPPRVPD